MIIEKYSVILQNKIMDIIMKKRQITVPYVPQLAGQPIEHVNQQLEECGTMARIDCVNWLEQFPYMPLTTIAVARTSTILYIKYMVKGSMLKALYSNDLEPVYKDSCVEFFCQLPDADNYMNFEFNCIGTCLASTRKSREEGIVMRTPEELRQIIRYSSLGKRAFCEMEGMFEWELTVGIPFRLLGLDPEHLPEKIKGNFYKCADDTSMPHFVSWSPIDTPEPDFHRPEFFGDILF